MRGDTHSIRKIYFAYFWVKFGNQDWSYVPHIYVFYVRVYDLIKMSKGKNKDSGLISHFYSPITALDNCIFWACYVNGYKSKNKKTFMYTSFLQLYTLVHKFLVLLYKTFKDLPILLIQIMVLVMIFPLSTFSLIDRVALEFFSTTLYVI